jgi:murein DD-endopeptidase
VTQTRSPSLRMTLLGFSLLGNDGLRPAPMYPRAMCRSSLLLVVLLCLCCGSDSQVQNRRAPVELIVFCPPTPAHAEGKVHLVYELHVTNFDQKDVILRRVDVLADNSAAPIVTYQGSNLEEQLSTPGRVTSEKTRLGGGERLVVFIWVTLDSSTAIPTRLRHRLTFAGGDAHQLEMTVEAGETPVRQEKPIVLRPPLRGGNWLARGGPSNSSPHRRAAMAVDGRTCDAQRFAIDWNKLDANGEGWSGDPHNNASYYSYGSEILAVADGTITELLDGLPENVPGSVLPHTFETGLGNHIVLDLGAGHYAFYAHMQPGKMRVHRGDHVHAGQVLGLVGNSGNATAPHLHFHVMDGPSPLGSEGLPYVIESFESDGQTRRMEIPLENAIVRFPDSH